MSPVCQQGHSAEEWDGRPEPQRWGERGPPPGTPPCLASFPPRPGGEGRTEAITDRRLPHKRGV